MGQGRQQGAAEGGRGQGEAGVQTLCHLMPTSCQPRANLGQQGGQQGGGALVAAGGSRERGGGQGEAGVQTSCNLVPTLGSRVGSRGEGQG